MTPNRRPQVLLVSARTAHDLFSSPPTTLTLTVLPIPVTPLTLHAYQTRRHVLLLDTVSLSAVDLVQVLAQTNSDPGALPLVAVMEAGDQRAQALLGGALACYGIITDAQARSDPQLLIDLLRLPPQEGKGSPLVIADGVLPPPMVLSAQEIAVLSALHTQTSYAAAAAQCGLSQKRLRNLLSVLRLQLGVGVRQRFAQPRDLAAALIAALARPADTHTAERANPS